MKIGRAEEPRTAISGSNPEVIIVRGRNLAEELIGHISFTEHIWLLITGESPSDAQRRILDAALVGIAEHGLVPSVVAARMTLAAAPEALQGAVAAGLLGCGSVILGSSAAAGEFLHGIVESAQADAKLCAALATANGKAPGASTMSNKDRVRKGTASAIDLDTAAHAAVSELCRRKQAIPGFGHPLHKRMDPRASRLFALAEELRLRGPYTRAAFAVEKVLPELTGHDLRINISAAIPAVLLDAGYPLQALKGVPLLARTASLIAHLLEEQTRAIGFLMAHAASSAITYDGAAPEGFVPNEN